MNTVIERGLLLPTDQTMKLATQSQRELAPYLVLDTDVQKIQIVDQHQQSHVIELPTAALRMLLNILTELSEGNAVKIVPIHAELTTQETADLLNVSRPHVVKLLEQGHIKFHKVGKHRRVLYADVLAYQQQQKQNSIEAMSELMSQAQALGMGYE
jgi:excisionase family DNA binding protein